MKKEYKLKTEIVMIKLNIESGILIEVKLLLLLLEELMISIFNQAVKYSI